jgi:hypothetical protein
MIGSLHLLTHRRNSNEARSYATDNDFHQLFATEITEFLRLALQLTADAETAERCLILAMRDCIGRSNISRNFAQVWARRMVIRNAIRLVLGIDNDIACATEPEFHLQPNEYRMEELRESIAVLDLAEFDRMAFVICVLERLSILDCALLLRRSPKDVNDAIVRATNRAASVEDQDHQPPSRFKPEPNGPAAVKMHD